MQETLPEVWLRGPLKGIPKPLQPVAHALLQAVEEVKTLMTNFPEQLLWEQPAGVASPGFHLLHMAGVLDRLFTYADGKPLSTEQLTYLQQENKPQQILVPQLIQQWENSVSLSLQALKRVAEAQLTEPRIVGRKALPSTVLGLLFHAAEHTMRHLGQLLVTVKVLKGASIG